MATRGSPARRIPGNALGGVMREAKRSARSTTRRSVQIPGPAGPQGVAGQPGSGATAVAVLVTDVTGVAVWRFPAPLTAVPVVTATPVATGATLVDLVSVTADQAVLRLWRQDPDTVFRPAPDATVHVAAFLP